MTSAGETLRRTRLQRNLLLEDVSRELRISTRMLEAIEANQFDRLPGAVFAKSFVRQYARLLELDEEELAREVQQSVEPISPLPLPDPQPRPKSGDLHMPRMDDLGSVRDRRSFNWSSPLAAFGTVIVVMLLLSFAYRYWQRGPRLPEPPASKVAANPPAQLPATPPPVAAPAQEPPVTAQQQAPAPTPAPVGQAPAAVTQQPAVTQSAAPTPPAPAASAERAAPTGEPAVRVQITAAEPVWVLARADGKFLFSGTLDANTTRTVEASESLLLRFGNAGGVSITYNGKPLGAVGPKGQVRTVQFTSGGFQIVPAVKPSAPVPL